MRLAILPFAIAAAFSPGPRGALSAQAPAKQPSLPPDFDAYVARVLETFQVPGASVAIVKDGRVLVARGYGVKKLGAPAPVTSRTRFGIASNTKLLEAGFQWAEENLDFNLVQLRALKFDHLVEFFVSNTLSALLKG